MSKVSLPVSYSELNQEEIEYDGGLNKIEKGAIIGAFVGMAVFAAYGGLIIKANNHVGPNLSTRNCVKIVCGYGSFGAAFGSGLGAVMSDDKIFYKDDKASGGY